MIAIKTYVKILIGSCIIGGLLAFLFYKDITKEVNAITKKEDILYLFQVGVFENENNANNYLTNYPSGIIYKDNNYYRVIIAIAHNIEALEYEKKYFNNLGINYYIKEIKSDKELVNKLNNYENIIVKSTNREVINNINDSMLQIFFSYLN